MIRKCREALAAETKGDRWHDVMSKSERTSYGYWLSKDEAIPKAGKMRSIRMRAETTLQTYAEKGHEQHDLKEIMDKFASVAVRDFLQSDETP